MKAGDHQQKKGFRLSSAYNCTEAPFWHRHHACNVLRMWHDEPLALKSSMQYSTAQHSTAQHCQSAFQASSIENPVIDDKVAPYQVFDAIALPSLAHQHTFQATEECTQTVSRTACTRLALQTVCSTMSWKARLSFVLYDDDVHSSHDDDGDDDDLYNNNVALSLMIALSRLLQSNMPAAVVKQSTNLVFSSPGHRCQTSYSLERLFECLGVIVVPLHHPWALGKDDPLLPIWDILVAVGMHDTRLCPWDWSACMCHEASVDASNVCRCGLQQSDSWWLWDSVITARFSVRDHSQNAQVQGQGSCGRIGVDIAA